MGRPRAKQAESGLKSKRIEISSSVSLCLCVKNCPRVEFANGPTHLSRNASRAAAAEKGVGRGFPIRVEGKPLPTPFSPRHRARARAARGESIPAREAHHDY